MVKCRGCGFLAVRNKETRQLEEAEEKYRSFGQPMITKDLGDGVYEYRHEKFPVCFARNDDLNRDLTEQVANSTDDYYSPVVVVINKERECEHSTEWYQGFCPKEHREMIDRERWYQWQENQRREDQRWRKIELIVLGIIAVVVAGLFTLIGAYIERGSI